MGLKLNKLRVENWCQHTELEHEFSPGTTAIIGPNGSGKSNFLAAWPTLLTGTPPNDTIEENMRWGAEEAKLEGTMTVDGTPVRILRRFKATMGEDEDGNRFRQKVTTTAKLEIGDQKAITGTRKVNEKLLELLGVNNAVLTNHVFIPQQDLSKMVQDTPAARLGQFLHIVPGVAIADVRRTQLAKELDAFPAVEVGVDIDHKRKEREELTPRLDAANTAVSELEAKIAAAPDRSAEVDQITRVEGLIERETELRERLIPQTETNVAAQAEQLEAAKVMYDGLSELVEETRESAESARSALGQWEIAQQAIERRRAAEAGLAEARQALQALQPPTDRVVTDDQLQSNQDLLSDASHRLTVARNKAEPLRGLPEGQGVCPECGQALPDQKKYLADLDAEIATLAPQVESLQAAVSEGAADRDRFNREHSQYAASKTGLEARIAELEPQVQGPSTRLPEIDKERAQALVAEFDQLVSDLNEARDKYTKISNEHSLTSQRLEQQQEELSRLKASIERAPVREEWDALKREHADRQGLLMEMPQTKASRDALADTCARLDRDLEELSKVSKKAARVRKYRALLERGREILHRNKLPASVLSQYTSLLNSYCQSNLEEFSPPFRVNIDNQLNIDCFFPEATCDVSRLSKGQMCVLSVALRFASNQLFARQIGVLALDEPTEYMDTDNRENMRAFTRSLREKIGRAGTQAVIVTHDAEIIPAVDAVIEIGA